MSLDQFSISAQRCILCSYYYFVGFTREIAKLPGKKLLENDGHDKTNGDDTDNENKRKIENDGGCYRSDRIGIDKTNSEEVLKTGTKLFLIRTGEKHCEVFGIEGAIGLLHVIENGRIINLGSTKPRQFVEVKHISMI
jgi:hypothetical protein